MSNEEGYRIDGEKRIGSARLACESRTLKHTDAEEKKEEHQATFVTFRDWCTHCMMGRGRTHDHVTNQKSEDQSRRPTIAMDYHSMKMKFVVNSNAMSEKSVTCIAVQEDRHKHIMSSVALKKGVEEPWTIERVPKFIDLLCYREITLKSDTELAVITFQSRSRHRGRSETTKNRTGSSRAQ